MRESVTQSKIIKALESEGWYVIKLIQTNKNGIPDLIALKNSKAVFIEVKSDKGKATELQLYRHAELRKKGFTVIITNDDKSIELLNILTNAS